MLAREREEGSADDPLQLTLPQPYLLFLGATVESGYAKTAFGLHDWAGERCVGEFALPSATVSTGLPRLSPKEARDKGAQALVIGVANSGGFIADSWVPALVEALESGLHIVSGMHARLRDVPEIRAAAERVGRRLIYVREPPANIPIATGLKRSGKRLLTVGTDCALGKKYTALAITRSLTQRGIHADFRATGQTGIMIAGRGIPMDAVVADFAAGAAEMLSPAAADDHWDVIEGQGSLLHPAFAGVTLSLLHGSQPDAFVVCHDPARERLLGDEAFAISSVEDIIELTLKLGARTNPATRCGGISYHSSSPGEDDAPPPMARESGRLGLPVADPMRGGPEFERLVDSCLA